MQSNTIAAAVGQRGTLADYVELLKPRLASLVLITTLIGYYMGHAGSADVAFFLTLLHVMLGTSLIAGGAMVLNQYMERDTDALMTRTRVRPLPEGRISPGDCLRFGAAITVAGVVYLLMTVHWASAVLGLFTIGSYLLLYTPLKTRTPLCTLVGAMPGAVPPLMGYAAASAGRLDAAAWLLFAILFVWQMPHFLAIAWLYRDDYAMGRQMMLPVVDSDGRQTTRQIMSFSLTLLPVTFMPAMLGMAGNLYFAASLVLGGVFLWSGVRFAANQTRSTARQLFIVSVLYLPLLLGFMVYDRRLI